MNRVVCLNFAFTLHDCRMRNVVLLFSNSLICMRWFVIVGNIDEIPTRWEHGRRKEQVPYRQESLCNTAFFVLLGKLAPKPVQFGSSGSSAIFFVNWSRLASNDNYFECTPAPHGVQNWMSVRTRQTKSSWISMDPNGIKLWIMKHQNFQV